MNKPKTILQIAMAKTYTRCINPKGQVLYAVDILPEMRRRYEEKLKSELVLVRFCQVEHEIYLEIVIDNGADLYYPVQLCKRKYHRIKIQRIRLNAYLKSDQKPHFDVCKDVILNASRFIRQFDKAFKAEFFAMLFCDESLVLPNPNTEPICNVDEQLVNGNLAFPIYFENEAFSTSLIDSDYKRNFKGTLDVKPFPKMPFFDLYYDGSLYIELRENQTITRNDPFDELKYLPKSVLNMSIDVIDDQRRWMLGSDDFDVSKVTLKTDQMVNTKKIPRSYSCEIDFSNGEKLEITGAYMEYGNDSSMKAWCYKHKVYNRKTQLITEC